MQTWYQMRTFYTRTLLVYPEGLSNEPIGSQYYIGIPMQSVILIMSERFGSEIQQFFQSTHNGHHLTTHERGIYGIFRRLKI